MQIAFPLTLFQTPTSGFDPLTLSPTYWFDASDTSTITFNGGIPTQVDAWRDKSGNANPTQCNNAPEWNSTGFNSAYPAVDLNHPSGGPKFISFNNGLTLNDFEILIAIVLTAGNTTDQRFVFANNFSNYQFMTIDVNSSSSTQMGQFESVDFTSALCPDIWNTFNPSICGVRRSSSSLFPYYNGVAGTTYSWSAAQMVMNTIGVLNQAFNVGCPAAIAEAFIFDRALSDADRGSLYNYMKSKWGLSSLPLDSTVGAVP